MNLWTKLRRLLGIPETWEEREARTGYWCLDDAIIDPSLRDPNELARWRRKHFC